mgnify:FL=1|tara:strand:+ start:544 stop:1800 length:1257 start_codon:yes stop_codon:yes gene_type:complete
MFQWTRHIICVLLCCFSAIVLAQSKEELQDKKEQLQNEIKLTNDLLNEAKKEKNASINTLSTLKRKIAARDEMISTLGIEIGLYAKRIQQLEQEVFVTEESIMQKQAELQSLKEEYAKLVYHAYHNRGAYDRLAFIFSAHSFHQAYKRIKYFQQYSQFRQQQVKLIEEKEAKLEMELLSLKQSKAMLLVEKNKKTKALGNTESEKQQLDSERGEQQSLVNDLAKKEKQLKTELKTKEQQAKALDAQIRKIIEEEIRKAKEAAASTGTPSFSMTPEQKELAENFTTNKGTLPWPVERGVITERFGKQKHPVLAGIQTYNNGVKITTEKGASARAIFDGTVSRILNIPGAGKAIIVSHGDYFSVYNNLSDVFVAVGQSIKTKQEIGLVSTNSSTNETITELQIWKGNKKLNPAQWLYRAY